MRKYKLLRNFFTIVLSALMLTGIYFTLYGTDIGINIDVSATEEFISGDFKYSVSNNEVTITGYIGSKSVIIIPETIDEKKVTCIGKYAFKDKEDIEMVVLPQNMRRIENYAFYNCYLFHCVYARRMLDLDYNSFGSLADLYMPDDWYDNDDKTGYLETLNHLKKLYNLNIETFTPNLCNNSYLKNNIVFSGNDITVNEKMMMYKGSFPLWNDTFCSDYEYAVYYQKTNDNSWTCAKNYNTDKTTVFRIYEPGDYTVRVKVKDKYGKILDADKDMELTVTDNVINTSSLDIQKITIGSNVTVNCSCNDYVGNYTYAVYYKQKSQKYWTCAQKYDKNPKVTFTPKAAVSYTVRVKMKDEQENIKNKDMNLIVVKKPKNISEISTYNITKGNSVTVKCAGKMGTAPYTYAIFYKQTKQSNWTCAQSYNKNNIVKISPKAATKYQIRVKLKDVCGNISNKDFFITVNPKPVNNSTISTEKINLGEKITINCAGENGTLPYKYAVYYRKSGCNDYIPLQKYSQNNIVSFQPTEAVTYEIRVKLRDANCNIVNKDFKFTVTNQ